MRTEEINTFVEPTVDADYIDFTTKYRVPDNLSFIEKDNYIVAHTPLLRLDNFQITSNDTCPEDFAHNFMVYYNQKYSTLHGYQEAKEIICSHNRNRSIIDIYMITKYYFNNATLKDIVRALYSMDYGLCTFICGDINKRVYKYLNQPLSISNQVTIDELNYKYEDYINILNN